MPSFKHLGLGTHLSLTVFRQNSIKGMLGHEVEGQRSWRSHRSLPREVLVSYCDLKAWALESDCLSSKPAFPLKSLWQRGSYFRSLLCEMRLIIEFISQIYGEITLKTVPGTQWTLTTFHYHYSWPGIKKVYPPLISSQQVNQVLT